MTTHLLDDTRHLCFAFERLAPSDYHRGKVNVGCGSCAATLRNAMHFSAFFQNHNHETTKVGWKTVCLDRLAVPMQVSVV